MRGKLSLFIKLLKDGKIKMLWKGISKHLKSNSTAFCLKRDLNKEYNKPRVLLKVNIRPFKTEDVTFFVLDDSNSGSIDSFKNCFVAETLEGIPCFRLWLIDASENHLIKETWGDLFPKLKDDEVYMESAYTVPKYRGRGLQAYVLNEVAEIAKRDFGANTALTYVATNNINSIRSIAYAGFEPNFLRTETWFLFINSVRFGDIPENLLAFFYKVTKHLPKKK